MLKSLQNWIKRTFYFHVIISWEGDTIIHYALHRGEIADWIKCYNGYCITVTIHDPGSFT